MEVIVVPLLVGIPVAMIVGLFILGLGFLCEHLTEEQKEKIFVTFFTCVIVWVLGLFFLAGFKAITGITILGIMSGK
jgi:hypothetical protein